MVRHHAGARGVAAGRITRTLVSARELFLAQPNGKAMSASTATATNSSVR